MKKCPICDGIWIIDEREMCTLCDYKRGNMRTGLCD